MLHFSMGVGLHTESIKAGHYVALGWPEGVLIEPMILIPVHHGRIIAQSEYSRPNRYSKERETAVTEGETTTQARKGPVVQWRE